MAFDYPNHTSPYFSPCVQSDDRNDDGCMTRFYVLFNSMASVVVVVVGGGGVWKRDNR